MILAVLALWGLLAAMACSGQADGESREPIAELRLLSLSDGVALTMHADGSAVCLFSQRDVRGRAGQFVGKIQREEFQKLADRIEDSLSFAKQVRLSRPYATFKDSFHLDVVRGGASRSMLIDSTAPAPVAGIRQEIEAVSARIAWKPVDSGVRGRLYGPSFMPDATLTQSKGPLGHSLLVVRDPDYNAATVVLDTDAKGRFETPLLPGVYKLQANLNRPGIKSGESVPVTVVVHKSRFTSVMFHFRPRQP